MGEISSDLPNAPGVQNRHTTAGRRGREDKNILLKSQGRRWSGVTLIKTLRKPLLQVTEEEGSYIPPLCLHPSRVLLIPLYAQSIGTISLNLRLSLSAGLQISFDVAMPTTFPSKSENGETLMAYIP